MVPVVVGSNPIIHPNFARVAELVDALVLGTSTYGVRVRVSPLVNEIKLWQKYIIKNLKKN